MSRNKKIDRADDEFIHRIVRRLDAADDELDESVQRGLRKARIEAAHERPTRRVPSFGVRAAWSTGLVLAALVLCLTIILRSPYSTRERPSLAEVEVEIVETAIIAAPQEDFELYEELEFYVWLAEGRENNS